MRLFLLIVLILAAAVFFIANTIKKCDKNPYRKSRCIMKNCLWIIAISVLILGGCTGSKTAETEQSETEIKQTETKEEQIVQESEEPEKNSQDMDEENQAVSETAADTSRYTGGGSFGSFNHNVSNDNGKSYSNDYNKGYSDDYDYDKGYEDVYENDDYDENRYENNQDYADGVDDALDDLDDEGEGW